MSSMNAIKNVIINITKNLTSFKDIDRNDLLAIIENEITGHKTFVTALSLMTNQDMNKFKEKLSVSLPSSKIKETTIWTEYLKKLQTQASQIEHKKMFDSLIITRKKVQQSLETFKKSFDKIFPSEIIKVSDIKYTQFIILGFISQSIILSNWTEYMFTLLSSVLNKTEDEIPKYRIMYLANHLDDVVELVNKLVPIQSLNIIKDIEYIKSKGADNPLLTDGIVNNTKNFNIEIKTEHFLFATSIFLGIYFTYKLLRLLGEQWGIIMHKSYLKRKELKEWMESHVAKLKLDLQDINQNDPQYQKLLKVIELYDEKIKSYDESINAYLND